MRKDFDFLKLQICKSIDISISYPFQIQEEKIKNLIFYSHLQFYTVQKKIRVINFAKPPISSQNVIFQDREL